MEVINSGATLNGTNATYARLDGGLLNRGLAITPLVAVIRTTFQDTSWGKAEHPFAPMIETKLDRLSSRHLLAFTAGESR